MRNTIRKKLELSCENIDWYERAYPGGSLTALVDSLLEKFRLLHSTEVEDFPRLAAEQVKEEVR